MMPPPVETVTWQFGWPLRKQLPAGGNSESKGHGAMYERFVAGKLSLPPLETARTYLLSLP